MGSTPPPPGRAPPPRPGRSPPPAVVPGRLRARGTPVVPAAAAAGHAAAADAVRPPPVAHDKSRVKAASVLRCARGVRGKRGVSVTISAGAIVNSNSAAGRGQQEEEAKHVRGRIEWPAPAPGEGVSVDCYWKEGLARKSGVGADRVLCLVSALPPMRNQATRQGTNLEINNKGDRSRVFPDSQTRYSRLLTINLKTTSRRYYVAPPHARARAWGRARPVGACCPLTPWYAPACGCCGVSGGLLRRRSLNWAWCCAYWRLIAPAGRRGLVV